MSDRRRALGRGLGALISNAGSVPSRAEEDLARVELPAEQSGDSSPASPNWLPVDLIDPNPDQPRRVFDPEQLQSLAASIQQHGVLQPVVVRPAGERYELVVGERRWRACRAAGLKDLPAVVMELTPRSRLEIAIVENVQRHDLNAMELAHAFHALAETGATQEEIGQRVSLDRSSVANHMRLLDLPRDFQEDVEEGRLSMGHARALLQVSDPSGRRKLRDRVVRQGLSVRATEKAARNEPTQSTKAANKDVSTTPLDPDLQRMIEELQRRFQSRVRLTGGGRKGHLEIDYFDAEDLTRIIDLVLDPS